MSRVRRLVVWLLSLMVVFAVVIAAVLLVQGKRAQLAAAPQVVIRPLAVRSAVVSARPWQRSRAVPARLEAHERVAIAARITAPVKVMHVAVGDAVRRDQPLLELAAGDLTAQVVAAEAALRAAEQQRASHAATVSALRSTAAYWRAEDERYQTLRQQGGVAAGQAAAVRERRDDAVGRLAAAEATLAQRSAELAGAAARHSEADIRRSWASLTAPFAGVVAQRLVDPGDLVTPGQPLVALLPVARRLWLDLPPDDLAEIAHGQWVYDDRDGAGGSTAVGQVVAIHPASDDHGLVRVEVAVSVELSPPLPVGATLPVRLVVAEYPAASALPHEALVPTPEGGWAVFAVSNGRLRPIRIERLGSDGDQVLCSGVEPGTRVVLSGYLGWSRLAAGLEVVEIP